MDSRLSPSANKAHEDSSQQYQHTGDHALLTPHDGPAMVTKEVLGEQFDQGRKHQQARRHGIHGSDEDQTKLRIGAIESMGGETNGLTDGGSCTQNNVSNRLKGKKGSSQKNTYVQP